MALHDCFDAILSIKVGSMGMSNTVRLSIASDSFDELLPVACFTVAGEVVFPEGKETLGVEREVFGG